MSTANKEEGHSKGGEATRTAGTGNQNGSVRMGGSDNKGDGMASQPRRYQVPGQPLLNRHQVGGVSRSPDGLFEQQREPTRGRPAVRGKRTYGGRPGQHVEKQGTWASRTQKHSEAGYGRPVDRGAWTAKTVKRPQQQPAHHQYANYWAPLTCKRHTMPHLAQPQHERGNDTSKSTGRSGGQKAATRRNMRREERVIVQGPVKEQQPEEMSHRGGGGGGGGAMSWCMHPGVGACTPNGHTNQWRKCLERLCTTTGLHPENRNLWYISHVGCGGEHPPGCTISRRIGCEALPRPHAGVEGPLSHTPTCQQHSPPVARGTHRTQSIPEDSKQRVHPGVSTDTLARPLWKPPASVEGTPRGRSSYCAGRDNSPTLTQ